MSRHRLIRYAAVVLVLAALIVMLASCSSSQVRIEERGSTCVQVRTDRSFGIARVSENVVDCPR